jgi:hypothetical protein
MRERSTRWRASASSTACFHHLAQPGVSFQPDAPFEGLNGAGLLQFVEQAGQPAGGDPGLLGERLLGDRAVGGAEGGEDTEQRVLVRLVGAEELAQAEVLGPVVQDGGGRVPVTSGAPDLLVVGVEGLGDVGVDHEADVGLVDAHAERRGRHDDVEFVVEELLVDLVALALLPAGVIRLGTQPALREFRRVGFSVLAGGGVQQAGTLEVGHLLDDGAPLVPVLKVADDVEPDVGPVEAVDQHQRVLHAQAAGSRHAPGERRWR